MTSRTSRFVTVALIALVPLTMCSCGQEPTTASSEGKPAGWKGRTIKLPKAGDPPQQAIPPMDAANK